MIIRNHASSSKWPHPDISGLASGFAVNFRRGGKCGLAAFSSPPQLYTVTFAERSRGEPNKIWLLVRKRTFIIYFFIALISSIVQEAFSFLSLPSCIFFT